MGRASRKKKDRREGRAPAREPRPALVASGATGVPLMPVMAKEGWATALNQCEDEDLPLWATLVVLSGNAEGKPAGACIPLSCQLVGALGHFGFEAEVMAACVTVTDTNRGSTAEPTEVGVWEQPPRIRDDGTTDGHVVVWSPSFERLVDLTVGQDPQIQRAARKHSHMASPVVVRIPRSMASGTDIRLPATMRGSFMLTYRLLPEHTSVLAPMWERSTLTEQLRLGALAVAYDALELVRLMESEDDRRAAGARMRALLDGYAHLPPLPASSTAERE
jgi:predicted RecA/RadA family phage recombinase